MVVVVQRPDNHKNSSLLEIDLYFHNTPIQIVLPLPGGQKCSNRKKKK